MIIKKPALSFSAYNNLFALNSSQISNQSSPTLSARRNRSQASKRSYATVKDAAQSKGGDSNFRDLWPDPLHRHSIPTPYQILQIRRGDKYSKHRFTELVKLYHPDRSDHPSHTHLCQCVPTHTRLERYRLIIAAHSILSDPERRSAYDVYGAGWGHHENVVIRDKDGDVVPTCGPDSAMGNATWEDWERWYRRRDQEAGNTPPSQRTVFLSNTAFVSLIVLLTALGGVGQATRADASTKSFLHLRDETHQKAAVELNRVRTEAMNWTKEERIAMFLRERDPDAFQDEGLRRLMLDPDICDNGTERHREAEIRRNYKTSNYGTRHTPDGSGDMSDSPKPP